MAKYLVRHTANPGEMTDPGDVIVAVDDSHEFGTHEDIRVWTAAGNDEAAFPDFFSVIEIPGMPLAVAQRALEPWYRAATEADEEFLYDAVDRYVYLGPRRWQLGKQDRLPPPLSNALDRDRFITLTYDVDTINSYMIDRAGLDVLITDTPINP